VSFGEKVRERESEKVREKERESVRESLAQYLAESIESNNGHDWVVSIEFRK
jgi:hypothetical protein